jgi:hypothetical protein
VTLVGEMGERQVMEGGFRIIWCEGISIGAMVIIVVGVLGVSR